MPKIKPHPLRVLRPRRTAGCLLRGAAAALVGLVLLVPMMGVLARPAGASTGSEPTQIVIFAATSQLYPYETGTVYVRVTADYADCSIDGHCGAPSGQVVLQGLPYGSSVSVTLQFLGDPQRSHTSEVTYKIRPPIPTGTLSITASYQGDQTYAPSSRGPVYTTVSQVSTSTSIRQDSSASMPGQPVTFTANIALSFCNNCYNAPSPTGQVQFYLAGNPYGSAQNVVYDAESQPYAQLTTSSLPLGTSTFVARYLGDANFDGGVSSQISHIVANSATSISLTSFQNPSVYGQGSVILRATVSGNLSPVPTGTVTIYNAGTPIWQGPLDSGGNYYADIYFDVGLGHNSITAFYSGDGTYPATSSGTMDQVVNQDTTSTTVTSSPGPSTAGHSVTFTSTTTVTAPGGAWPTGTVSFYVDNGWFDRTLLGTSPIDGKASGIATFSTSGLSAGTYSIFAVYSGDTYCRYSGSVDINQVVNPDPVSTVSAVGPRSGSIAGGTIITVTGTKFSAPATLKVGGTAATNVLVVSATKVTAKTPAHALGTVDVRMTTPSGTSAVVAADHYTYVAVPLMTSVSPSSGTHLGGQTVTITGTNFTGATAVKFGTTLAASFTVVSRTKITAKTPAHALGTVDVRVTTAGGTSAVVTGDHFKFI